MLEFSVVRATGAVFTPEFNIGNVLKIANLAMDLAGDRLDGEPTIMPLSQDAPPEIPRIILRSSDKLLSFSVAPVRTSLEFRVPPEAMVDMIDYPSYYSGMGVFFSDYSKALDLRVQRLGYVTERLTAKDDVISYVLKRFCDSGQTGEGRPFHGTKRFEIHSMKNYEWKGLRINSWVRIKCLQACAADGETKPVLLVENDLNTLSYDEDPGAVFTPSDMNRFFSEIPDHLDEILQLYFPEE